MQKQSRKSLPWEQQHISSVRVIGIVREVIPISFRELHFVVDCEPESTKKKQEQSTSTTTENDKHQQTKSPSSTISSSRNWVDVHATGTWAARCALLVVGDRVEMQHFGVYRPVSSQILTEQLMMMKKQNTTTNSSSKDGDSKKRGNHLSSATNTTNETDAAAASSNKTVQFWEVPEHRMCAPFVLSPVVLSSNTALSGSPSPQKDSSNNNSTTKISETPTTSTMSTFIVERGQKLILHDEEDQRQNYDGMTENDDGTFSKLEDRRRQQLSSGETNLRTQGSHTPQQLFVQSAQQQKSNSDQKHSSSSGSGSGGTHITSIGNSIGKNLFSNVYRFVDVMRGLNRNLLPLLKKIQRACSGAQHVLDAGCGSGLISFAVKCADPAGPEMVATDRSRAMSALVQEKNNTFAGLINSHTSKSTHSNSKSSSNQNNNNNNNNNAAPLVQFVLGDLSASPDRFIILPAGASATEVAVEGRKQFDVMLCIDVLSYLPSVEAMKRALFNLALHAKPKARLILSVPNLLSCAADATKLSANSTLNTNSANSSSPTSATATAAKKSDVSSSSSNQLTNENDSHEQRPKIQRSLHFQYDRHTLSLGSSTYLSQGGVLDVVERQFYDALSLSDQNTSSSIAKKETTTSSTTATTPSKKSSSSKNDHHHTSSAANNKKLLLRRHTEWFGFSCPNAQSFATHHQNQQQQRDSSSSSSFTPNTNTGEGTPQIFYESLEELILHPTVLETLFDDMGWKVEEVWLFNALERGGEFADPGINTLAVLGGVPGGSSAQGLGKNAQQSNNMHHHSTSNPHQHPQSPQSPSTRMKVGFDDEATTANNNNNNNNEQFSNAKSAKEIEASFTHRLYTLVKKSF